MVHRSWMWSRFRPSGSRDGVLVTAFSWRRSRDGVLVTAFSWRRSRRDPAVACSQCSRCTLRRTTTESRWRSRATSPIRRWTCGTTCRCTRRAATTNRRRWTTRASAPSTSGASPSISRRTYCSRWALPDDAHFLPRCVTRLNCFWFNSQHEIFSTIDRFSLWPICLRAILWSADHSLYANWLTNLPAAHYICYYI